MHNQKRKKKGDHQSPRPATQPEFQIDETKTVTGSIKATYKEKDLIKPVNGGKQTRKNILVFRGQFNGTTPIALKRYESNDKTIMERAKTYLENLSTPERQHPNIIRYFGDCWDDGSFLYLATELCDCSVADIIHPSRKTEKNEALIDHVLGKLPIKDILRQSTEAVKFIHSIGMIHRNLHPDNFLVLGVEPNKDHYLIKLTDFQRYKNIEEELEKTNTFESEGWDAPEHLLNSRNEPSSTSTDAFILGCYYFYVLSGGEHPFGRDAVDRQGTIKCKENPIYKQTWNGRILIKGTNKNKVTSRVNLEWKPLHLEKEEAIIALDMIKSVIKFDGTERKPVKDILEDPYFLTVFQSDLDRTSYNIYHDRESPKPGLCIIISQAKYRNPQIDMDFGSGKGVLSDAKTLEETFTRFGYDICHFKNLRAQQIEIVLSPEYLSDQLVGSSKGLSIYASLVICILSHGDKGTVKGVDDVSIPLNQLQYAFNSGNCRSLEGKPKIFIVFACQGINTMKIAQTPQKIQVPLIISHEGIDTNSAPFQDFLRLSSTIEEFTSWVGEEGSGFVIELCKALSNEYTDEYKKYPVPSNKRDLAEVFTAIVIPKVCNLEPDVTTDYIAKQNPEHRSSLKKTIRFQLDNRSAANANNDSVLPIPFYDGEIDDPSFEPGRSLWPLTDLYYKALKFNRREEREYQFLLKTVHAVAGKESHVAQRAFAWVIINRARKKQNILGGSTYEGVCKELIKFCKSAQIDLVPSNIDKDWKAIDQWLPNVENELSIKREPPMVLQSIHRKAWDPSRGSLGFLKDGPTKKLNAKNNKDIFNIQFGNLKFYKVPVSLNDIEIQ